MKYVSVERTHTLQTGAV